MICQLCGEKKKLIQSHIIPRSFYKSAHLVNNCTLVSKDEHSKPLPIGIYDMEIVCDDCEKKFSTWDNYGNKFFNEILPNSKNIIRKGGRDIALLIHDINYVKLKLFLLSVLWRASTSIDSFFDGVSLGPFESNLKEKILAADPTNIEEFAVIISKFNLSKYDILHPPYRVRLENGINGYKFLCGSIY